MSLFITFEGPEGSGKSTQARLLYEHLQAHGYPVILVREPGGTRISDLIRQIVLDLKHTEMAPVTETLLFSAARAQLVTETIRPYLFEHGGIVLCDRYADSTYAYQGYGLGRDLQELHMITRMATGGLEPDATIYLDLSAEEGLERKARAKGKRTALRSGSSANGSASPDPRPHAHIEWNRLDARTLAFHKRVEAGYRALIEQAPERWYSVDARQDIATLAQQIWETIVPLLEHVKPLEPDT